MPISGERSAGRAKARDSVLANTLSVMEIQQEKLQGSPDSMLKLLDQQASALKATPRYLALSLPYLPCTRSVHDLEDTNLSELELEGHNRGKAVHVSRRGPLVRGCSGTLCVVVDVKGDAAFLEVTCTDPQFDEKYIREGAPAVIKEPFVTAGRDVTWCIKLDHPNDLCLVKPLAPSHQTPSENKELGNACYKKRQLGEAAAAYEAGLRGISQPDAVFYDLHRNLAQVYLSLGFWELARRHAKAAQTQDTQTEGAAPGVVKALIRGASASFALRDLQTAKCDLTRLLKMAPQDETARSEMLRVYKRLNEQAGTYDFDSIISSAMKIPCVDAAAFTKRTAVSSSAGKGNGLFAAEDLNIGDLVLCEKAFTADFTPDDAKEPMRTYDTGLKLFGAIPTALWTTTVQKIVKNSSLGSQLLGLGGNWEGLGDKDIRVDDIRIIDVFQVHDIIARNSFGIPTPTTSAQSDQWGLYTAQSGTEGGTNTRPRNTAIFCHAAFINHSCLPNVEKRFIGDVMIIRAARPIREGDEILLDYAPGEFHDARTRKAGFERSWQFACDCELCMEEGKHPADVLDRRISLIKEVNQLSEELSRNIPASIHWDAEIARLEGLASELHSTYGPSELPKALGYTYTTLAVLYGARKNFAKHIEAIGQAFDSLGWYSPFDTAGVLAPKPRGVMSLDLNVPQLLYMACSAASAMGHAKIAEEIKKVEPKVYLAPNAVMNGFQSIDARMSRTV